MNDSEAIKEIEKFKSGAFWKSIIEAVKQSNDEVNEALGLDATNKEANDLAIKHLLNLLVDHYVELGGIATQLSYHEELEIYREFEKKAGTDNYGWRNVLRDLKNNLIEENRKYL